MSKEYWGFEHEDGQTAFLAGVIDALSDKLSLSCEEHTDLDADIFYIEDGDISKLEESVKKRLYSYMRCYSYTAEDIEKLKLGLESTYSSAEHSPGDKRFVQSYKADRSPDDEFWAGVKWHLGETDCVYELDDRSAEAFRTNRAVCDAYLGIVFYAYFVTFKHQDYALMMIYGSSE